MISASIVPPPAGVYFFYVHGSLADLGYFCSTVNSLNLASVIAIAAPNSSVASSTSASATSPVLQVGYTENLTKNLQLSIGVLQYSSGLSLSHSSTTVNSLQETQTALGDSAIMGTLIYIGSVGTRSASYDDGFSPSVDARTEVTQVGERTVNIEEIVTPAGGGTIEAEIKAPTVISISLQLSF